MNTDETGYYPWKKPCGENRSGLKVNNSLTGTLTPFVLPEGSNRVSWYICGPTVYDSSHVGHASNYVRFDVVRRLLSEYFGYDVEVQMNVTDIDDKIIKKANERNVPFLHVAKEFEQEFLDDMAALNVRPPDHLTRVTDFVPEIVAYIEKIIDNGFAYESQGSVYFDVTAFSEDGHGYAKTAPWCCNSQELLAEGEGALADGIGKKDSGDFALWKRSKEGEPKWESPWGDGRPGWHIECSAMAEVLGKKLTIHAGGVDLRFPHHANEIAQAEAFHKCHQWVDYFLHSGHLHIDGLKMSKSLKNFITIRACLQKYNARQMRLLFLSHKYDAPMDYAESSMIEAVNLDRTIADFFGNLKAHLRELKKIAPENIPGRPGEKGIALGEELQKAQDEVHRALANNFDTPKAMLELQALMKATNSYMNSTDETSNIVTLESVGRYISSIFTVFGLTPTAEIAYGGEGGDAAAGQSREESVAPILDIFVEFRDQIRAIARTGGENACKDLLKLCDDVRDDTLPPLGIRLEDGGKERSSVWKLEDAKTLMLELKRKKEAEEEKIRQKEALKEQRRKKEIEELLMGKLDPEKLFRDGVEFKNMYKEFDDQGLPTVDIKGEEVSKSARKVLMKRLTKQKKLHVKYQKAVAEGRIPAMNGVTTTNKE